jgi:hypothetical protein
MAFLIILFQIGDLFRGEFNLRGVFHLFLFVLMGLALLGFTIFIITKAFKSPRK